MTAVEVALAVTALALLALVVRERWQHRRTQARLEVARFRTPSRRESELVRLLDERDRHIITVEARKRLAERERDEAVASEKRMRASLHDRFQARREEAS